MHVAILQESQRFQVPPEISPMITLETLPRTPSEIITDFPVTILPWILFLKIFFKNIQYNSAKNLSKDSKSKDIFYVSILPESPPAIRS